MDNNIQDSFLSKLQKDATPVMVFLMNGYQMKGIVTGFDSFVIMLSTEGRDHMVYKHFISTIVRFKSASKEE